MGMGGSWGVPCTSLRYDMAAAAAHPLPCGDSVVQRPVHLSCVLEPQVRFLQRENRWITASPAESEQSVRVEEGTKTRSRSWGVHAPGATTPATAPSSPNTHTIARQTGNNSVSECQNPRQLDIKQDKACLTPIGAFLHHRARGRGTSCSRSRPSPALGSRAER